MGVDVVRLFRAANGGIVVSVRRGASASSFRAQAITSAPLRFAIIAAVATTLRRGAALVASDGAGLRASGAYRYLL